MKLCNPQGDTHHSCIFSQKFECLNRPPLPLQASHFEENRIIFCSNVSDSAIAEILNTLKTPNNTKDAKKNIIPVII